MIIKFIKLLVISLFLHQMLFAQDNAIDSLLSLSMEELVNMQIAVASKTSESIDEAPAIISVISKSEIDAYGAKNLGEVLNRVVSMSVLSANVFMDNVLNIRGQSLTPYDNHTLILLNGRPVRDPISGGLNNSVYTSLPLSAIEQIEIIRGPGSVLYGSCAFSGVVNIVTKNRAENGIGGEVDVEYGSFNSFAQELRTSFKSNDLSATLSFYNHQEDGPLYHFVDYTNVESEANFDRKNIGAFMNVNYKGLHINATYARFAPYSLAGDNNNWTDDQSAHNNNIQTTLFSDIGYTYKHKWFVLDANTTYNSHTWNQTGGVTMTAYDVLGELTLKMNPVKYLNIISGATFNRDYFHGERFINNETNNVSIYSQVDYSIFGKLKVIAGVQWNKIENIKGSFSPRLGAIWHITNKFGAKLIYSQAFRKGYPLETAFKHPVFKGNLDLKPELINTTEAQLFFNTQRLRTSLTYYNSKMNEIIVRNWYTDATLPYGGYLKYENGGSHTFNGVEFEGRFNLSKAFQLYTSFNYQTNENDAGIENAALHPNTMFKSGLFYDEMSFRIGIFNSYFGTPHQVSLVNTDLTEQWNKTPESYNLLSAKLTFKLKHILNINGMKELDLSIRANNLLDMDIRYPEYTSKGINSLMPLQGGRSVFGAIKVIF